MTRRLQCADAEALLFDYSRDELSPLKHLEVEEHLRACQACQDLAAHMKAMIDQAGKAQASDWSDLAPDPLFARIQRALTQSSPVEDEEVALEAMFNAARNAKAQSWGGFDEDALFVRISRDIEEKKEEPEQISTRRPRVWAMLAAAAGVVLMGAWGVYHFDALGADSETHFEALRADSETHFAPISQVEERVPTDQEPINEPTFEDAQREEVASLELPPLEAMPSLHDSLNIYASKNALYEVYEKNSAPRVALEEGTVLVEYLPQAPQQFALEANGYTIMVTGTIFYVIQSTTSMEIGVYEGAVNVLTPEGETFELRAGEATWRGEQRRLEDEHYRSLEAYVDIVAHRRALEPEQVPKTEPVSIPVSAKPRTPASRELRQEALDARHRGEYAEATRLLEQALEATPAEDMASADILLELASIHLRNRDDWKSASMYLERFLERWPDDVAAQAITNQLCLKSAVDKAEHPLCN